MAGRIWGGNLLGHRFEFSIEPLPEPAEFWLVERMEHTGGWKRVARFDDGPPAEKAPLAITPPARLRCTRRVDGRIAKNGVEWTAEHPDAAERYEQLRLRAEVEEQIEEWRAEREADQEPGDQYAERIIDAMFNGELDDLDPDAIRAAEGLADALRPGLLEQWSAAKEA